MFGNNGTNGMGNSFEADVNYYLNAAEALGAKVILNSYTPHGAVSNYSSGYNSMTHKFNSYRQDSYDVSVRSIASQRAKKDSNYLGFVEIGKNADNAFNAYVADYAKNGHPQQMPPHRLSSAASPTTTTTATARWPATSCSRAMAT